MGTPRWSSYDAIEELVVPEDLQIALAANPQAAAHVAELPPSSKKIILWWIASARRADTRGKRIAETVRLAAQNLRANHYRR